MASISKSNGAKPSLESGDITPEEAAVIRAKAAGKEQAPSAQTQSLFSNWRDVADQLGSPFEVEKIPISKLRAMRRDPMLGFGLSFIKTPHVRAKWFINARDKKGPNAQVAAHLDNDLRRIYASLVMQYMNQLDFGFQALVKRFEFHTPGGTYIEVDPKTGEQTQKPIWKSGAVQPIAWKSFTPLRPEAVNPVWDNNGDFNGINYDASRVIGYQGGQGDPNYDVDLAHALWVTNEKEGAFGSIFGYPRLGYAYRYWWSYWFRWSIADRAFERKADPSVIVRYPEGKFLDAQGVETSYQDYALEMGARMRSGGVIALPSEPFEGVNGPGNVRTWDIEFTKDSVNFEPFDKSFEYLDVQKLRSLFIPEQAFLEGKGGTSSRNVAAEMGQSFLESQAALSASFTEMVNRYVIPQWLAVNYPDFINNNGTAELVIQGFLDEDTEFMRQVIQLIGQDPTGAQEIFKMVDLQKLLEDRGMPIVPYSLQQKRQADLVAQQQQTSQPGATAPVPGAQVGVVPTATGFSYIQPREIVYLSDSAVQFLDDLPTDGIYRNPTVRSLAKKLWLESDRMIKNEYNEPGVTLADDIASVEVLMQEIFDTATKIECARAGIEVPEIGETIWFADHVSGSIGCLVEGIAFDKREIDEDQLLDLPTRRTNQFTRNEIRAIYNAGTLFAAKSAGIERVIGSNGELFGPELALTFSDYVGEWRIVPPTLTIESVELESGGAVWEAETSTLTLSTQLEEDAKKKIILSVVDEVTTS